MRGVPFLHEGFIGGLNTISDPYMLSETECRECMNVVATQRGSIRKRFGSTLFTASPPNVELHSLAAFTISGTRWLVAAGGKNLYSITTAGAVETIGEGFTEGKRWTMTQAPLSTAVSGQGPVYLSNGTDKPQYWAGTEAKTKVAEWKGLATKAEVKAKYKLTSGTSEITIGAGTNDPHLTIGAAVEGTGIPSGTKIAATVSTTVLRLTENATETKENELTFTGLGEFYEKTNGVPNGKYLTFAGNRIWMTGVETDPSAVFFSGKAIIGAGGEQNDASSWPVGSQVLTTGGGVLRLDPEDGQPITGIGLVGPYVLVFKEFKTWVIHNLDTGQNRKISDTVGCIANRSIVESAAGTFFLTADQGVYLTDGAKLHEMSYNVRPTLQKINAANRENAAGAYNNNHYYISFPSETSVTNNRTLDYDAQLKSWWLHDLSGNQWATFAATAGEPQLFLLPAKTKAGVVKAFVKSVYQDSEVNYVGNGNVGAFWVSPWNPFAYYIFRHRIKAPFLKKRVRQIFFNGEGQIIPAVYKNFAVGERQEPAVVGAEEIATKDKLPVNFAEGAEKFGEGSGQFGNPPPGEIIFGGETSIGAARIYAPGVADLWSVGWGNNSSEGFTVNAYVLMVSFRKS